MNVARVVGIKTVSKNLGTGVGASITTKFGSFVKYKLFRKIVAHLISLTTRE